MKRERLIIAVLALMLLFSFQAFGAEGRVFDQAGIFTEQEIQKLEASVEQFRHNTGQDGAVVTAWAQPGRTAEAYGDDFYDENDLGTGRKKSGILLLYYMDGPESESGTYWISTSGTMIQIMTDARIEEVKESVERCLRSRDFVGGAEAFLSDTAYWVEKGIQSGQYTYDRDTGEIRRYRSIRWYEAAFALGLSLFAAGAVCLDVKRRYAMKLNSRQQENGLLAYRAQAGFRFTDSDDRLVNQFVSHVRIPRQNHTSGRGGGRGGSSGRSTVHRSSGGRSHGGGGGRF